MQDHCASSDPVSATPIRRPCSTRLHNMADSNTPTVFCHVGLVANWSFLPTDDPILDGIRELFST